MTEQIEDLSSFSGQHGSEMSEILLNAGAELNAETIWGDTAVHYAAFSGTLSNLKFLVESGGKVTKDKEKVAEGILLGQEFNISEVRKFFLAKNC